MRRSAESSPVVESLDRKMVGRIAPPDQTAFAEPLDNENLLLLFLQMRVILNY